MSIDELRDLARATDAAVLHVEHTSKSGAPITERSTPDTVGTTDAVVTTGENLAEGLARIERALDRLTEALERAAPKPSSKPKKASPW